MRDLPEALAERYYEAWQKLVFGRVSFSRTSLEAKKWKDLPPRDQLEFIEAARTVLADKEIMQILTNRAGGL